MDGLLMDWYWVAFFSLGVGGAFLPLYMLARLVALAVCHERRDYSQPLSGKCARCGYLLIGLPEPRCPECGQWYRRTSLGEACETPHGDLLPPMGVPAVAAGGHYHIAVSVSDRPDRLRPD